MATKKKTSKKTKTAKSAPGTAPTEPPESVDDGPPTKSMRPAKDSGASAPQTPDATEVTDSSVGESGEDTDVTTVEGGQGSDPPPASADSSTEPELSEAPTEDVGAARARRRRLDRRDPTIPSNCPVTGRAIDSGPRADVWSRPTKRVGVWMSALGAALIDAQATIEEFTEAVAVLGMLVDCGATPSFGDPDLPLVLNDVLREGEEG